jgi:hypothetical protein
MGRDNGIALSVGDYEAPFADATMQYESEQDNVLHQKHNTIPDFENPFTLTYESETGNGASTRVSESFVELLAELHDNEFSDSLHAIANELEENVLSKVSDEANTNGNHSRYIRQRAQNYFAPLYNEVDSMIDKVSSYMSQNESASDTTIERFINELEFDNTLSPAQEQFFGKIINKVKSVAKKVKSVAEKLSPVHIVLNKIKGMVRPLLNKVLTSLIGKLPQNLRPYAQTLAKRILNQETFSDPALGNETLAGADFDGMQREFDLYLSNLVFERSEIETEELFNEYLSESEADDLSDKPSLNEARHQFVQQLKAGEAAEPAIEQFVPVIMGAAKVAISLVGRQRVVNFLGDLIAKFVSKWIPPQTARPLATSIVDLGLKSINLEAAERTQEDIAYEAIASTVEEAVRNVAADPETAKIDSMSDAEAFEHLAERIMPAFNKAAANNFPGHFLKRGVQVTRDPDVWILMPRRKKNKLYKKYTKVFSVSVTPQLAGSVKVFGDVTLAQFMKDTLALNPSDAIQARVHIYEAIPGTWLSRISLYEKVPGLGSADKSAWSQLHPLTVQAASVLLNEPALGKDVITNSPSKVVVGQRFFYLEIPGATVRRPRVAIRTHRKKDGNGTNITARSGDVQAVLNFVKSEVVINYFLSETESATIVDKLNKNDWISTAEAIRQTLRSTLSKILLNQVASKVKIIHESVPELYLQNVPSTDQFVGALGKVALEKIVEKATEKFVDAAHDAVRSFFKAGAAEFKEALAKPEDGVTIRVTWTNVPGMAQIKSMIRLIRGEGALGDLKNISFPSVTAPSIKIIEGKNFV